MPNVEQYLANTPHLTRRGGCEVIGSPYGLTYAANGGTSPCDNKCPSTVVRMYKALTFRGLEVRVVASDRRPKSRILLFHLQAGSEVSTRKRHSLRVPCQELERG